MILFIGSDVHGSEANLLRFLDASDKAMQSGEDVKCVLLGDIYNHGPRNPFPEGYAPMKAAELLNRRKDSFSVIKGNCDSEVDQMISEFQIKDDFCMQWMNRTLYFTHGHRHNPDLPIEEARKGDIVFYGHFHTPKLTEVGGVRYVCVGALGLSPEGVRRSYAVVDGSKVRVVALDGGETLIEFDV